MLFTDSSPAENCRSTDGAHAQPSCSPTARGTPPPPDTSLNPGMVGLFRDLKNYPLPALCHGQGHLPADQGFFH